MLAEILLIKKSVEHKQIRVSSPNQRKRKAESSFLRSPKGQNSPCARFEGELYRTFLTSCEKKSNSIKITEKRNKSPQRMQKFIPTVDVGNFFDAEKYRKRHSTEFFINKRMKDKTKSIDGSKVNNRISTEGSVEKVPKGNLFELIHGSPKRAIKTISKFSKEYVRRHLSRY